MLRCEMMRRGDNTRFVVGEIRPWRRREAAHGDSKMGFVFISD